jgi:hypothetical protein
VATLWGNQLIFLVMSGIGLFGALCGFYLHFKLKRSKNNHEQHLSKT